MLDYFWRSTGEVPAGIFFNEYDMKCALHCPYYLGFFAIAGNIQVETNSRSQPGRKNFADGILVL